MSEKTLTQLNEKELKEIIKQTIQPQLEKQFYLGMQAGYNACLGVVYGNINKLHSKKEIQTYLKNEINNTKDIALIHLAKENSD